MRDEQKQTPRDVCGEAILDSGFQAVESRCQALSSGFSVSGTWISDSDLEVGFRIPKPRVPDFTSKTFPNSGFCKPKF